MTIALKCSKCFADIRLELADDCDAEAVAVLSRLVLCERCTPGPRRSVATPPPIRARSWLERSNPNN
jgi:hypothetical protein